MGENDSPQNSSSSTHVTIGRYDLTSIETNDPEMNRKEKKKWKNVAMSFLLNLGGGVSLVVW